MLHLRGVLGPIVISCLLWACGCYSGGRTSTTGNTAWTADSMDVAKRIRTLEAELAQAVVTKDVAALLRLEAPGYVYTDSDAKLGTRDEFIKEYQAQTSTVRALRFDSLVVDVYPGAAIVRGVLTVDREDEGVKTARRSRYTRVYVPCENGWCAVAGHSSAIRQ